MARERVRPWVNLLVFALIYLKTEGSNVSLTFVETAVSKGAVCLDGSPPAYHFDEGFGTGADNWLLHIEGGGWCNNVTNCRERMSSPRGSSKLMKPVNFTGILSNRQNLNPDFFNWNRVKVRYCDGASFTGDIEEVDPATNIHFRGARIFPAVIEDLLAKGMKNAKNALLSGCSAGGLTSILHCDYFKALLPNGTKLKCLSDAGFFINVMDVSKDRHIKDFYKQVVSTHGSAKNLPGKCTQKMKPGLCFFPQNMAKDIQTPLFILNSAYDSWQIRNSLAPGDADPHGLWHLCKYNFSKCTPNQLNTVQDFRLQFLKALNGLGSSTSRGIFIDSCYEHCQSEIQEIWLASGSPELNKTAIAMAVGDWYYDRRPFREIDCAYPCNPTCHAFNRKEHAHSLE